MTADVRLVGRVKKVIYEAPDSAFKIISVKRQRDDSEITVAGELPEVAPGAELELEGHWQKHEKFGYQLRATSAVVSRPETTEGLQRYLASDLLTGVGPKTAEKIVEKFGKKTIQVMDEEIEKLKQIPGIGESKLEQIKEDWEEQRHDRETMLFLKKHGISTAKALKINEVYGRDSRRILEENPYRLCREVEGFGFKTADRVARKLGLEEDAAPRLEAALEEALRQASEEGHVYLERQALVEAAGEMLTAQPAAIEAALERMVDKNWLVCESKAETEFFYLPYLHQAEERLARNLKELLAVDLDNRPLPAAEELERLLESLQERRDFHYNRCQRRAIKDVLREPLLVLTGGPGTGKTTSVIGMLDLLDELDFEVELAAPTGRAAQRLAEATGHSASTIHRLLDYKPPAEFGRDENNPLETDVLIVDELSMVDLQLMDRLLRALEPGTRLVMVGDADQLPPVGPGNVLADLIASPEIPTVELEEIYRQARRSLIVLNAHRVNRGEMPRLQNDPDGDFFFLERSDPVQARQTVVDLVARRLPDHYGFNPFEDLQVVAPLYRGECGVDRLNAELQAELNPGSSADFTGQPGLRDGDRVMQLQNNYDKFVFNGDVGRVVKVSDKHKEVGVSFGEDKRFSYSVDELDELTLAYAVTIHKSQGGEFPGVIIPLLTQHYVMLERNLLYTALTRASEVAVLVGSKKALGMAVNRKKARHRNSNLKQKLNTTA